MSGWIFITKIFKNIVELLTVLKIDPISTVLFAFHARVLILISLYSLWFVRHAKEQLSTIQHSANVSIAATINRFKPHLGRRWLRLFRQMIWISRLAYYPVYLVNIQNVVLIYRHGQRFLSAWSGRSRTSNQVTCQIP